MTRRRTKNNLVRGGLVLPRVTRWVTSGLIVLWVLSGALPASAQAGFTWSCFPISLDVIGDAVPRVETTCAQATPSGADGRSVRRFALPLSSSMAARFSRLVNVARVSGLVLNLNYDVAGANSFTGCDPVDCRRPNFFGVAKQGVGPATCPIYNPYEGEATLTDFCTAGCPCQVGQGDCDNDAQCAGDARCANDVGAGFGLPEHFDVCLANWCVDANGSPTKGVAGCWRNSGETAAQESECAPTLWSIRGKCRRCPGVDPTSSPHHAFLCTPACPCGRGFGNCNTNADCRGGDKVQKCVPNVGAQFGLPSDFGVCLPIYWE